MSDSVDISVIIPMHIRVSIYTYHLTFGSEHYSFDNEWSSTSLTILNTKICNLIHCF